MSAAFPRFAWRTFHAPKAGNAPEEYEDAFAGEPASGRFAIADGASESAFADAWARILVTAYVQARGPWSSWLPNARRRWDHQVQERELPWYSEAAYHEGAYAAMLGIAFTRSRWRASAVGDCCLFQVRDGCLHRTFPMRHSCDFGNRPSLLGSRGRLPAQPRTRRVHLDGEYRGADLILLMTDALAEWMLKNIEAQKEPWIDLQRTETEEQFAQLIQCLRETKELRNDDATLLLIQPAIS